MRVRMLLPAVMIVAGFALFGCSRSRSDSPLVRAVLLLSEEKLPEALVQCDQALAADLTNCQAWLLRGEINQKAGNLEAALVDYSRAVELDPENSNGQFYRNALLELQGTAKPPDNRRHEHDLEPLPLLAAHDLHASRNVEDAGLYVDDGTYPEDEIDSYENRYGQAELSTEPNAYRMEPHPEPAPLDTPYRRWLKSQTHRPTREAPDMVDPLAMPLDYYDQQHEMPSAPPPRQVASFGYQLGDRLPGLLPRPIPTTGRRRTRPANPPDERYGQFVGQRVPFRAFRTTSRARPMGGFACLPPTRDDPGSLRIIPSCSDGRDNNGNGYVDRGDPACWLDGMNRSTYSPQLYEVGPPAIAPLPATITPQAVR